MIPPCRNSVSTGISPGNSHCRRCGIRSILAETNHLGTWNDIDQTLGQFDFQGRCQAERYSRIQLLSNRPINLGVAVTEHHRQKRTYQIYIFISVGVPDMPPLSAVQK